VQPDSFAHHYASKTDDEILALHADQDSLTDEARLILADELRRRNVTAFPPSSDVVKFKIPTFRDGAPIKALRTVGVFIAHLIAAILGTAMVESPLWAVLGRPRSLAGIEAKTWATSLAIATLLGFYICKFRPGKSATWVWLIPGTIFALRVVLYGSRPTGSLAKHFLAPNCIDNPRECQDFLVFTISAARAFAYSAGAWASMRLQNSVPKTDTATT
jgi:hypothetical protein